MALICLIWNLTGATGSKRTFCGAPWKASLPSGCKRRPTVVVMPDPDIQDGLERVNFPGVRWHVVTREGRLLCQVPALFVYDRRGGVPSGGARFVSMTGSLAPRPSSAACRASSAIRCATGVWGRRPPSLGWRRRRVCPPGMRIRWHNCPEASLISSEFLALSVTLAF